MKKQAKPQTAFSLAFTAALLKVLRILDMTGSEPVLERNSFENKVNGSRLPLPPSKTGVENKNSYGFNGLRRNKGAPHI